MSIKTVIAAPLGFFVGMALLTFAYVLVQPQTAAASGTSIAHAGHAEVTTAQATKTPATTTAKVYTYTAQPGDSYSKMARKATQTYGITNKVKLTPAQIIYVETNMTQAAGSPFLEQGQKVTINQSDVKAWADKAQKLDAATLAAWEYYVPSVDFNTNDVGQ